MSKIKIRNFGPVKKGFVENDGWIDIQRVTIFTGNQGSGKSTVAKLISTFTWMEKALTRGDFTIKEFTKRGHFKKQRLGYHRLENYDPHNRAVIEYRGNAFHFKFRRGQLTIDHVESEIYDLPQIMYVPAERNFISYIRTSDMVKQLSPALSEFVTEVFNAALAMKGPMLLPINKDVYIEYQALNNLFYLKGKDYRIRLTESASGFQSLVPLFIVSWFLAESVNSKEDTTFDNLSRSERARFQRRLREIENLSEELRRAAISELSSAFTKTAFINIVEEPEQNLFPVSQWRMLLALLAFNNLRNTNQLIITTHSPYVLNYLSLAVKAGLLEEAIAGSKRKRSLEMALNKVFSVASIVKKNEYVIYELDEKDGSIKKLPRYNELPSDENYLNNNLEETNELFAQLLEIQQRL